MKETIYWSKEGEPVRRAVVELAGWTTQTGKITRTGERIASQSWEEMSPAARNVLLRAGVSS